MTVSKLSLYFILTFILTSLAFSTTYNQNGDFSVNVESQQDLVYNDLIESSFEFDIKNNIGINQDFDILVENQPGWNIELNADSFTLESLEEENVVVSFKSNNNFDYSANVVSPDEIKIVQKEGYTGSFTFPITIVGDSENVSLSYLLKIETPSQRIIEFNPKISTNDISPIMPLKYTISGSDLTDYINVYVKINLNGELLNSFTDSFSFENNYKIYQQDIPTTISPGSYNTQIVVRLPSEDGSSAKEWYGTASLNVVEYNKVDEVYSNQKGLFKDTHKITITNVGNVPSLYQREVSHNFIKGLLFGTNLDDKSQETKLTNAKFSLSLNPGESKEIVYSYNYLALYILLLVVLIIISYIYIRKSSNPLDVETSIYDLTKVAHEGVKSFKVKIGFENIKVAEIDSLKIVFRMPSYLQVKDGSFSLTEPKNVLKGKNQFKLIWDFKKFAKNDARIIGFTLVNKRGVLGDIKIPDLEIEVKVDGKTRKYYGSFPTIKG